MKPPLQHNQDNLRHKATDHHLKTNMKRSRSFKRSDHDGCKPVTRQATPNYMKSTRSWEARREDNRQPMSTRNTTVEKTSNESRSKMGHRLGRTSSLDDMVRSLTKAPSFKPARATQIAKSEVQKPTCSSTLKDSKFPPYLVLNPGGTESEGTSAFKVCPYTYCSLNGHYHNPVTPLKQFVSAKRRALKTMIVEAEEVDPLAVIDHGSSSSADDTDDVFFVQIHVHERDISAKAHEDSWISGTDQRVLSEESHGLNTIKDNLDEEKDVAASYVDSLNTFGKDLDEDHSLKLDKELAKVGNDSQKGCSVDGSLDDFFLWILDMEWKEAQFSTTGLENGDVARESDNGHEDLNSEGELDIVAAEVLVKFLDEIQVDQVLKTSQEEIIECRDPFSDLDSSIDGEWQKTQVDQSVESSSKPGNYNFTSIFSEQQLKEAAPVDEANICQSEREDEIFNKDFIIKDDELLTETEVDLLSVIEITGHGKDSAETDYETEYEGSIRSRDTAEEDFFHITQGKDGNATESIGSEIIDIMMEREQVHEARLQPEKAVEHNEPIPDAPRMNELFSEENLNAVYEAETSGIIESDASPNNNTFSDKETGLNDESSYASDTSKRTKKSRKPMEDTEQQRGFNPREPNYLPLEPDPDAERVDLRHQEIDERKDANEWMLDYALQRAVSKLAPARKKKVALMIAAFETVLPIPKFKTHDHLPQSVSGFPHMRLMQACS